MMDSLNKQHFELSESVRDDTQYNTNKQVIGKIRITQSMPITAFLKLKPQVVQFNTLTNDELIHHQ